MAPLQRVLYVENNVGLRLSSAFNLFTDNHDWGSVFQHHVHPGMQRAQNGDEWWLNEIADKGYALLTCDMAIVSAGTERDVVLESGLRYVGFHSAQYDGWTQMRALTFHWDALKSELEQDGPVIIELYYGQTVPKVERP